MICNEAIISLIALTGLDSHFHLETSLTGSGVQNWVNRATMNLRGLNIRCDHVAKFMSGQESLTASTKNSI